MPAKRRATGAVRVRWLLLPSDQACAAVMVVMALLALLGSWLYRGGLDGRLINIERAGRLNLSFQLDVNSAERPEWSLLPGIGDTLARRIVESRRRDGPYETHEDLLRVRGIGPKTLDNIRPYLLPITKPNTAESRFAIP